MSPEEKEKKPKAAKAKSAPAKGKPDAKGAGKKVAPKSAAAATADYKPRLKTLYLSQIVPDLQKRFGYKNPMMIPHLVKITLNVGMGSMHQDQKLADSIAGELRVITGLKPVFTRARRSISNFKLRQGMVVGCSVNLRRSHMYEFLDRLIAAVIPRVRDFRGFSDRSFDGRGNYSFGIKEQIIFPEIDYDKVVQIHGMNVTICTNAATDEEAYELLRGFGFPFPVRGGQESKEAA